IVEEIVFRGMIIRVVFRKHLFIGLVVSSLVFASLHES
ncbi:CPBP family glutamic-type intramembrane protease, partial [Staphylococcus aureus]